MAEQLPIEVQVFLQTHIDSLVALDALLLLRTDPARPWELAEIARGLTIAPSIARRALADLQLRNMVTDLGSIGWLVVVPSTEIESVLTTLEALHRQNRWLVARHVAGTFLGRLRVMTTAFTRGAP